MNEHQIACFLDVAETQHLTQSANRLRVAQPALSRIIHHLEEELGCQLFERKGRSIALTADGELVQRRLKKAASELACLREDLAASREERDRIVRVQMQAASHLVVEAISSWMGRDPAHRIRLVQGDAASSAADVVIACALEYPALPTDGSVRLFVENILVAIPQTAHVGKKDVALADLSGESFISLAGSRSLRQVCDALCVRNGFRPAVTLESDNPAVVRKMIALGLGVGFWPEWTWGPVEGDGVELKRVAAPDFTRTISIACCTDAGREFFSYLCDFFAREQAAAHAGA